MIKSSDLCKDCLRQSASEMTRTAYDMRTTVRHYEAERFRIGWRRFEYGSGADGLYRLCDKCARPALEEENAELRARIGCFNDREREFEAQLRFANIRLEGANIAAVNLMQAAAGRIVDRKQLSTSLEQTRAMSPLTQGRPLPAGHAQQRSMVDQALESLPGLHPKDKAERDRLASEDE